jgi:hypothetical protein
VGERSDIASVDTHDLRATAFIMSGRLLMSFCGGASTGDLDPLDEGLKKLHAEAVEMKVREVTIDFRDLEKMTPRCFKSFVEFIGEVASASEPYRIRFLRNPDRSWQTQSLKALACTAPALVTVEG